MPNLELPSNAERQASKAATLSAFAGLSLPGVRSDLIQLLQLIRSNSMFEEYTKHDISHVDRMLPLLDWLIPADTQAIMTPADWLLIVLATYFHDLGMLITREEFENRNLSAFSEFKNSILQDESQSTQDYLARINRLSEDEAERFLYQEYVRQHHASRIRTWIEGKPNAELGITEAAAAEMARITLPLQDVFAEDLATVCESHHLSDLDDTTKYPISRPYGSTDQETANVQYAAALLRTIDLLDITTDRAPAIAFRIINPRDPISQQEWVKQGAVRTVRAKVTQDSEGNLDPKLPKEGIEVHARFDHAEGYFGLTSYLSYAEAQLRQTYTWIVKSNRKYGSLFYFPWRFIDVSNIEAKGFIPRPFSFSLNQDKILELLTGHTLYNETSVVIRELIQNAIDAVRIEFDRDVARKGKIELRWRSAERVLEVLDNGTGMTQEIIEQNFLSVGTSYYQSPRFREAHPSFHPISRFGIGVLSAFMVADQVEVITSHPDDPDARKLELRTVHGRYLIRLLDKRNDTEAKEIGPHGTMVRLYLRPSADLEDIVALAQKWIVVPACSITAFIDGKPSGSVGYESVKVALEAVINSTTSLDYLTEDKEGIRIVQLEEEGVSLAYAVRWSSYFKEWSFITTSNAPIRRRLGTCVEGIRVQTGAPGFSEGGSSSTTILAIANACGARAPKTNVARSGFEYNSEYERTLRQIYGLYTQHVINELNDMQEKRNQSLTWAASEATYLLAPLTDTEKAISSRELLSALKSTPILLVEEDGVRKTVSANHLAERESFWTIEGPLPSHIEYLLREIAGPASMTKLLQALQPTGSDLPDGPLLCTRLHGSLNSQLIYNQWQVAELRGNEERRRSEARWIKSGGSTAWSARLSDDSSGRWFSVLHVIVDMLRTISASRDYSYNLAQPVRIPLRGVSASGFDSNHSAVSLNSELYLLPGTQWIEILNGGADDTPIEERDPADPSLIALGFMLAANGLPFEYFQERFIPTMERQSDLFNYVNLEKYLRLRQRLEWRIYDASQWQRWGKGKPGSSWGY